MVIVAVGASECSGPEGAINAEVEMLVGVRPQRCGGPSFVAPDSVVDARCVTANQESGMPYERWLAPTSSQSGVTYNGELSFVSEGSEVIWLLTDGRADEGRYLLKRCINTEQGQNCEPEVCLENC